MKIGLFFGSFNPVHNGHLIIANYIRETTLLDQVWLVVSPHNPLKQKETLLNEHTRLHLIQIAIDDNPNLRASNIEFKLPQPSYTIDTLTYISEKYPQHQFSLIMGSDNLESLPKWKNYEQILSHYKIIVYKRTNNEIPEFAKSGDVTYLDVPLLDISSTFIRHSIKSGVSMKYFLPDIVWKYIDDNNLYRK